ncbi:hypothetical protein AB9K41_17700, partial [Cribrihabitans sp. XS_ASV171]
MGRVTGDLVMPPDLTAIEWVISFFKGLTAEAASAMSGTPVNVLVLLEGSVPGLVFPPIPGAAPNSAVVNLVGSNLNFTGGNLPSGTG